MSAPVFQDAREVDLVIGGFLRRFPALDPVFKAATDHEPLVLKLELHDPELEAEIDLTRAPLQVRFGTGAWGTVGLSGPAANFHLALLGLLPVGVAINEKKLLVRGSAYKMARAAPLLYLAPQIYPYYLEAIGRSDLILPGPRPALHGEMKPEDMMSRLMAMAAYVAGYALGMIKAHIAPGLDILAALESLGQGLATAAPPKPGPPRS